MPKSKTNDNQAYFHFLDTLPALLFIQDCDKKSTFFNKAWLTYTNQSLKTALGKNILDSVHPNDRDAVETTLNQSDEHLPLYIEFRLKSKDGYHWVCDHRTPLFDDQETFIGYLNTCYDIHTVKLTQDAIAAREERYDFAVDSTGIGVWDLMLTENSLDESVSQNKNKLIWNDNMFQIYNVDPGAFQGNYQDFEQCVHPDDRKKVKHHIDQCFKTKGILKIQFRIISHPSEIRYISALAKTTFDNKGKPIRLTGINEDVTAVELEKLKIKELLKTVHENEKKYRALFESSSDAIMLLSLEDNTFFECNDSTLTVFGCASRKQFLGMHPSDFSPTKQPNGQTSIEAANERIASALRDGKASFPWMHQRLNGEDFPAEVLLTPVTLKNKAVLQATVRDTTELVALQNKLMFLSMHDQLTGLYNRNGLTKPFTKELAQAIRYNRPLSVLMLDIDFFKEINDTYGHPVGDRVLKHLASKLLSSIRAQDIAIRYGGEEFITLLPETDTVKAKIIAERLRQDIEKSPVSLPQKKSVKYTISVGIASVPKHGKDKTTILTAADKALYHAKNSGRNKVVVFEKS